MLGKYHWTISCSVPSHFAGATWLLALHSSMSHKMSSLPQHSPVPWSVVSLCSPAAPRWSSIGCSESELQCPLLFGLSSFSRGSGPLICCSTSLPSSSSSWPLSISCGTPRWSWAKRRVSQQMTILSPLWFSMSTSFSCSSGFFLSSDKTDQHINFQNQVYVHNI